MLKELTREIHGKAERKEFARRLISGDMDPCEYFWFLVNQRVCYSILECGARRHLPENLYPIFRWRQIEKDIRWFEIEHGFRNTDDLITDSTKRYVKYLFTPEFIQNPENYLAHIYVRHFGDIYGGSIVEKNTPGPGNMYKFFRKDYLISEFRKLLKDDMEPEVKRCFGFAINLFEEGEQIWIR